jgi:glycosyltransferase involved in cell wall biosynthesis
MLSTSPGSPQHCLKRPEPSFPPVQLYRRCGVDRPQLVVVPEPVDTRAFDPAKHTALPLPIGQRVFGRKRGPAPASAGAQQEAQGPFVFLSIFKWEERKGWDVLLRAYLEEFGPREEVLLLLLTKPFYSGSDFKGEMRAWAAERLPSLPARGSSGGEVVDWAALPGVYVHHKHLPQQSLPRLYKAAGAFVLPSRCGRVRGGLVPWMPSQGCAWCSEGANGLQVACRTCLNNARWSLQPLGPASRLTL